MAQVKESVTNKTEKQTKTARVGDVRQGTRFRKTLTKVVYKTLITLVPKAGKKVENRLEAVVVEAAVVATLLPDLI
jgi:hypothetical protein